jgi:hypothetical protein
MSKLVKRDKSRRLIKGLLLKCVDGKWTDGDGLTPSAEMLVIGTTRGLQCWGREQDLLDEIPEEPDKPLPDVDALNAQIPEEEWGLGLNGKPRPPWSFNWIAYLIDPLTAGTFTFINSTWGAQLAVERLEERMENMRVLRGANVRPIVRLENREMTIKRLGGAVKLRPEFTIIDWRDLGVGINQNATPQIEHKAETVTEPPPEHKKKAKATVGKPVKPVTISEEIDDGLPDDLAPPNNILKAG